MGRRSILETKEPRLRKKVILYFGICLVIVTCLLCAGAGEAIASCRQLCVDVDEQAGTIKEVGTTRTITEQTAQRVCIQESKFGGPHVLLKVWNPEKTKVGYFEIKQQKSDGAAGEITVYTWGEYDLRYTIEKGDCTQERAGHVKLEK